MTRSLRVYRNPIEGLRGTHIGGTIGGRVAYSLLHGFESMPREEVSSLLKAKVATKPLLGIAPNSLDAKEVAHFGTSSLTYRGCVRQIRGVSRVAMSHVSSPVGKLMTPTSSNRYRYSTASSTGAFLDIFKACAWPMNSINSRVGA